MVDPSVDCCFIEPTGAVVPHGPGNVNLFDSDGYFLDSWDTGHQRVFSVRPYSTGIIAVGMNSTNGTSPNSTWPLGGVCYFDDHKVRAWDAASPPEWIKQATLPVAAGSQSRCISSSGATLFPVFNGSGGSTYDANSYDSSGSLQATVLTGSTSGAFRWSSPRGSWVGSCWATADASNTIIRFVNDSGGVDWTCTTLLSFFPLTVESNPSGDIWMSSELYLVKITDSGATVTNETSSLNAGGAGIYGANAMTVIGDDDLLVSGVTPYGMFSTPTQSTIGRLTSGAIAWKNSSFTHSVSIGGLIVSAIASDESVDACYLLLSDTSKSEIHQFNLSDGAYVRKFPSVKHMATGLIYCIHAEGGKLWVGGTRS